MGVNTTTEELSYITFNTDMGWVGILASANGLLRTTLPQRSAQEACQLLGDSLSHAIWSPHLFKDLMERLKAYFNGHKVAFPDKLDLSRATHFQREVWEITRLIPYGETRSYAWVAERIKKPRAVRAVGQALSKNPLPIIVPCHRVVASDGKLGGFGGGVEMKRYLLSLEASASPAGLDPVNTELLKEIILELRSQDKAIILSTHRMNEVEELCDRIFMINRGQNVLYGELAEIKSQYRNNSILLEFEGDLSPLDGVTGRHDYRDHVELFFDRETSPHKLLEQLMNQEIKINRFEVSTPSLNDIFLQLVGKEQ